MNSEAENVLSGRLVEEIGSRFLLMGRKQMEEQQRMHQEMEELKRNQQQLKEEQERKLQQMKEEQERKLQQMKEEQERKQQQTNEHIAKIEERLDRVEGFLSNMMERLLPKVEKLLAVNSSPSAAAEPQAEKGATAFAPTSHSSQSICYLSSTTTNQATLASTTPATTPTTRPSPISIPATTTLATTPSTRPSTITNQATLASTTPATTPIVPAPRSLIEAAERGDAQSLRRMLAEERGGDIGEELKRCLLVAHNGDVVKVLLGDVRLSVNDNLKERAMYEAVESGRSNALEAMLHAGFPYPEVLLSSAWNGNADCLRVFVRAGCNVNETVDGTTALHEAAFNAHDDCVRLLLEAGADVTATNSYYDTPLHNAAFKGATECAQLLLNAGADVNAVAHEGLTPLLFAAEEGATQCARLLIDAGADVNAPSLFGTPLKLAQDKNHEDTVRLLRKKGGRQ